MDGTGCPSCGTELGATAKFCSECGTPVARTAPTAEYKQVTVLFADVVHSMDIARRVGPERLREIMAELVDCASSAVERFGGTVDKFTGDGIMAVFGAPIALEDHAQRACLAALGIQDDVGRLGLQLRIGLNSGQVIAGEIGSGALGYTAIGEHVGMAQRMESAAPPGGVMLSASTARLVDASASLGEPELVQIKGVDEPIPARRLLSAGQHGRMRQGAESNLVGRRWEMSAIEGLLDRAVESRGAVVGVVGPPGIGKSRLTRELAALASRRGVDVFTTYCESHTTQVPFHVVSRLLRAATGVDRLDAASARALVESQVFSDADPEDVALFEDLLGIRDPTTSLARIDPEGRRRRLTALVNAATLASTAPAVYIVEDAHWIDESSESLLADFLTVVPQTRILTLITYRPEYHGALAMVAGAQSIALTPLTTDETESLVSALLGTDPSVRELRQSIAERAAGTPFFAEEIVLELSERGVLRGEPGAYVSTTEATEVTVPATLQATIASRIDRLDPKAKRTLSAAAVVGSRFGADLLRALDIEPEVGDLLGAQLIDQVSFTRDPEYVFHHPLIRAVAYETQLKSDRADLHRRVASAIERREAESLDEKAALIAEHFEAAGDLKTAFNWHMRAGAWSNYRDVAAALLSWDRAREVADRLPESDTERLAMRIAPRALICAAGWRVASDDSGLRFDELRELCTLADDKASLAMAMMGPLSDAHFHGETRESARLASEHLAILDSIGDPALTAGAAFGAIGVKAQTGEFDEVLRWAQATIDWADGDPTKGNLVVGSPLAVALALRGLTRLWFGQPGWREDGETAYACAEASGDPLTISLVCSWNYGLGVAFGVYGVGGAAIARAERALQISEASAYAYAADIARYVLGGQLIYLDSVTDWQRGRELLVGVEDGWTKQHVMLVELAFIDALVGLERAKSGDFDNAIPLIQNAVNLMFDRNLVTYYIPPLGFLLQALLDRGADGDVAEAEAVIARLAAAPIEGSVVRDIWLLRMRALLAHAKGDDAGYRDARDRYREMATLLGFEGHAQWAAAML